MTGMKRHKAESSYPRGEETRSKIIAAAIALFGQKGFAGVTTREIATAAGVPAPSLQYYFENKEGLYLACIEHFQTSITEAIRPALDLANARLAADAEPERLIDAYCGILESLADFLFGSPDAASRALFVAEVRRSGKPKVETKRSMGKQIQHVCAALVSRIGKNLKGDEAILIATTINGQLFVIHLVQEHIEELMGWDEITPDRLASVKAVIRRQTTAVLEGYITADM
jgi:TetR/AcrR family transcriptional regulator, regulator of cefoperazone and chloramphenicol sensitivity